MTLKGTTICAVARDGKIAVAGDGQVTMGESTIFKATAHKVRRIYGGKVVTGFAGTVSDAFALSERFEGKLEQYGGNLERAAVELAQEWRVILIIYLIIFFFTRFSFFNICNSF